MGAERIIEIARDGARLSLRDAQLVIARRDQPEATVPINDLAVLVVANERVSYTHPLLVELSRQETMLVLCDSTYMPAALLTPVVGHSTQSERLSGQAEMKLPIRKRLWQTLVQAKIGNQAALLKQLHGSDGGLKAMSAKVRSGDSENLEAQAARRYWSLLFPERDFRRRREGLPPNALLNYGYAILRATVARAIVASGLHPGFGLHHHNRYDGYCLASDMMEPLRPTVDHAVVEIVGEYGFDTELIAPVRAALLESLTGVWEFAGEKRSLFDVAGKMTATLARIVEGKKGVEAFVCPGWE